MLHGIWKTLKSLWAWLRALKPGGKLLIYDANWYSYLNDPAIRSQFENNLKIVSSEQLEDYWHGEGVDEALIEEIARQLPLTKRLRPSWDLEFLNQFEGVEATVDTEFGPKIWSREEELNYAATPMFALYITKEADSCVDQLFICMLVGWQNTVWEVFLRPSPLQWRGWEKG